MSRVFVCDGQTVSAYPLEQNEHWGSRCCAVAVIDQASPARSLFAGTFRLHDELQSILGRTVALRGLTWLSQPLAGSQGSAAYYWVEHPFPERQSLLLLQYLPPHSVTSVHWHTEERELFFPLRGSCTVLEGARLPDDSTRASKRIALALTPDGNGRHLQQWWVEACVVHQLRTDDDPALNLILVTNTRARTLQELNHHYVRWED